jgi:cell division protein FtsW
MNRLPLSTNDFVFPIMVEELGFIGGLAIIGMFLALGFAGVQLASALGDSFARTAVAALALTLCMQGLVNIATTIGTLPLSGMTLPFFSQGGTSLVTSILALGTMFGLGLRGMLDARQQERQGA